MKHLYILILSLNILYGFSQETDDFYDTDSTRKFENDCVRGIPEPLIYKNKFPNSTFRLENGVGFETVIFSENECLILKNTGCESYVLVLRFEVPSQNKRTDEITFWYKRLVKLISEVADYIDSPINLKNANKVLINYIDNYGNQPLKLGEYITVVESEIPEMMVFQKIKSIGDNKAALEFSIWIGPL